jgi:quercetin dioxygenase-like cupin family protein
VPIEIRRFGVGHRRPVGPDGSIGLTGQVLHADGRGTITELAFARNARIEPHASPDTTYLIVIEGGGWVGVGDEWTRIAAGEAAVWPADVLHTAWTEHSEMRAVLVEFGGSDDRDSTVGRARAAGPDDVAVGHGVGELAPHPAPRITAGSDDGEPA